MNSHLNIFNTYAKENRQYQLENDLTRAFAICMQEDPLFFNEVLKAILDSKYLNELFNDLDSKHEIAIHIQKNSSEITGFEKIYAVSLSEHVMTEEVFWKQDHQEIYDPICDIVIKINEVAIIIEAKRDNVDCTAQLYNQVFNVCQKDASFTANMKVVVSPKDLNWPKLMGIAVRVHSFEKATGVYNRFLSDFIDLVKQHNFLWLPEPSIFAISSDNTPAIRRRIESAINELDKTTDIKKLDYYNRLGVWFDQQWAQEVLFHISEKGSLLIAIYPGNTKAQGWHIFTTNPQLRESIPINGKPYAISWEYHIKFTSFQRYFAGLWFKEDKLLKPLYTSNHFFEYCGRKRRGKDWANIANLFDEYFQPTFDWRSKCEWQSKVEESGRNQFDLSFGFEVEVEIPFDDLKKIDQDKSDLSGLMNLISAAYEALKHIYEP
jgi:hypothetical protein